MICKICTKEMKYISGNQNGGYYVCNECNKVDFSNRELDTIVEIGRD